MLSNIKDERGRWTPNQRTILQRRCCCGAAAVAVSLISSTIPIVISIHDIILYDDTTTCFFCCLHQRRRRRRQQHSIRAPRAAVAITAEEPVSRVWWTKWSLVGRFEANPVSSLNLTHFNYCNVFAVCQFQMGNNNGTKRRSRNRGSPAFRVTTKEENEISISNCDGPHVGRSASGEGNKDRSPGRNKWKGSCCRFAWTGLIEE